jgi:hypothetical protein
MEAAGAKNSYCSSSCNSNSNCNSTTTVHAAAPLLFSSNVLVLMSELFLQQQQLSKHCFCSSNAQLNSSSSSSIGKGQSTLSTISLPHKAVQRSMFNANALNIYARPSSSAGVPQCAELLLYLWIYREI